MVPVYLIVGLINIFSQHHNYGIKIDDPDFDIRVRRSVENTEKLPVLEIPNYIEKDVLKREKREPYYKKTIITDNDLLNNNESQIQRNLYDIYNPNYSFINFTKNNQNNTDITNNKPVLRPNPYRYTKTGYNTATTTSGYRNQNDNTPEYYNYQNPSGRNFGGFAGYTESTSGYIGVTSGYYSALRDSSPNNYLLNNAQTRNSNSGLYNNLVVNNKENLPQYAVNYNNAYSAPNNHYAVSSNGYAPSSNGYVAPSNRNAGSSNGYVAPSNGNAGFGNGYAASSNAYSAPNNRYAVSRNGNAPSNGYVAPSNGNAGSSNGYDAPSNGYVAPSNGYVAPSNGYAVPNNGNTALNNAYPSSNTYATPSQNDYAFPSINDYNTTPSKVFPSATTNATPSNIFPSATTNATPSNVIPSTTITSSSNPTGTTTEKIRIKSGCVICNIPCPKFMRRFGRFCIDENYNDY